jgi:hypothetical protein
MKQTSKLEKLITSKEEKKYETTIEDCEEWFHILNEEIFDNKLPVVDYVDIRWRRKAWAYYHYVTDSKNPNIKETALMMNKRYKSKQFFVEVLAHELVHHYQFMFDEDMEDEDGHGESFMKWKDKFNEKGLKLVKSYDNENE